MVNFNSGKTPSLIGNSVSGGMAISYDGTRLAMGCKDEVKIFSVTFSETGVPTLTRLHSIKPAMGANSAGLAFDRAGNVYVISNSSERLGVWALPKIDNTFLTPAPSAQQIIVKSTGNAENGKVNQSIRFYPNPVTDKLTIQSANESIQIISIYDVNGKLLIQTEAHGLQQELELSELNSGIYILKVKTGKETFTGRIIKK